jgi:hypothetical protein
VLYKFVFLILLLFYGCNPPTTVQFSDVTESLGLDALISAYGLSLGDWNGDQCLDLFVASHHKPSHFFENDCQGKFIDRIEQFGTEVTYRLNREGGPRQDRVFLAPGLAVKREFRLNHETFLFYRPPRSRTSRPAYYIWRDLKTMVWHVRWLGEGANFAGMITWGVSAHVTTFGFKDVDRIRTSANSLDFSSAVAAEEEKGVDIRISPFLRSDVTITFDLRINGEYAREDIYIGAIGAHPWGDRFSLGAFDSLWIKPSYRPGSDLGYFLWRTP